LKPPLEALLVSTELRLGFLLVSIADSAYKVRDVGRGDEAKARGQAAYFRANWLLTQVAECNRESLVSDLEFLQTAINGLSKDQQSAFTGVIRDKGHPEEHSVLPSKKQPRNPDAEYPVDLEIKNLAVRNA
jgi:hypothetical protein